MGKSRKKKQSSLEMTDLSSKISGADDISDKEKDKGRLMNKKTQSKANEETGISNMAVSETGDTGSIKVSTGNSPPSKKSEPSKISDRNKTAAARTGRPPTTSVLRSAMYYQNRIIVFDTPETRTKSHSSAHASPSITTAQSPASVSQDSDRLEQSASPSSRFNTSEHHSDAFRQVSSADYTDRQQFEHEASTVTMDSRGVDIVVTDPDNNASRKHSVKKNSIWRRIAKILQDNRMKGRADAEQILAAGNPQDYRILKKVLNIIFLTVGIALLMAVIIVIIYTTVDS